MILHALHFKGCWFCAVPKVLIPFQPNFHPAVYAWDMAPTDNWRTALDYIEGKLS